MKLDAKVKGGLAWAGLVVILAVPAADLLLGKPAEATARTAIVNDTRQVTPVVPVAKPAGLRTDPVATAGIESTDPVQRLLDKGKKMPSYISDADKAPAPAAAKPVAATPPAVKPAVPVAAKPPVEVASIAPVDTTPPVPLPRSARPHPAVIASAPAYEQPLIIEDNAQSTASAGRIEPLPLSDDGQSEPGVVTGDQLQEWDSGSLADYLKRKGLLSQNQQQVKQDDQYDADGFYLDEGPNNAKRVRRIGPADSFFLF